MNHIIYKTTCTITGKWYIGMHSSSKLNDRYLGSGKIIYQSLMKHGRHNHIRETLMTANSREELRNLGRAVVTEELIKRADCMNLAVGGCGSGAGRKLTQKSKDKMSVSANARWARGIPESLRAAARGRHGVLHGRSKTWSILSPSGVHHLTSSCAEFCKDHEISYYGLRNKAITNDTTPIARGPSKGWSVLACTKMI